MMPDEHLPINEAATDGTPLLPPLRSGRLLTGLTGEESSRRFNAVIPARPAATTRTTVKRTYELEDAVVQGVRRQAILLGVNANDLANALLAHGLQALANGDLEASIGILPEELLRGPRAAGRYINGLRSTFQTGQEGKAGDAPDTSR